MSDAKKQREGFMGKAYDVVTPDDSRKLYDGWASSYDNDLTGTYGYVGPAQTLEVLLDHLQNTSTAVPLRMLDAGCGTGLLGELLRKEKVMEGGWLEGVDISEDMLAQSKTKGIYDALFPADLTDAHVDSLVSKSYDVVVSSGTFTHGHVGPNGIYELLRSVKAPVGLLCFSVNLGVWESDGYQLFLDELVEKKLGQVLEIRHMEYLTELGIQCKVVVIKKA